MVTTYPPLVACQRTKVHRQKFVGRVQIVFYFSI
uniref:Uncharacterized protein n=1 Tax=Lepeophtheirus salmonis TaxID=72036 RepID=A0A0K2TUD3_LEPSM